jgi:DNA topoisomerase I
LRRSNCAAPGILRQRRGRSFEYLDPDGKRIGDPEVLERIAELVIPPGWRDVWICMDPRGHLQATGVDAAGRKQYLYHARWRAHRDRHKFDSMLAFGAALPRLRRGVARDLKVDGAKQSRMEQLTESRVLACAIRLLDLGFFRIGSEDYAERNESYGLTTMLREHVTVGARQVIFDFPAKSGQRRVQAIADPEALAMLAALKRRHTGSQLLAYRATDVWRELTAEEVNAYLKRTSGGPFTAKDFRTWNATVLAAIALASADGARGRAAREREVKQAIKTVAAYLGNTPAVCRASYVDPRAIDRFHAGVTIAPVIGEGGPDLSKTKVRALVESAVLELLEDAGSDC